MVLAPLAVLRVSPPRGLVDGQGKLPLPRLEEEEEGQGLQAVDAAKCPSAMA